MSSLNSSLKKDYQEILELLTKHDYRFESLPAQLDAIKDDGSAYSIAYPIQGILKYHGFADSSNRIAFFPSISLNNGCAFTVSYLKFDSSLKKDYACINGEIQSTEKLERVKFALNNIRDLSSVSTKAILVSRNVFTENNMNTYGKGLGTSASASAALATAAIASLYDNIEGYISNQRLKSLFSRYLSGSGCRSATGGFSLWLSHPEVNPLDSYAIRLDRAEHEDFINSISLITFPIEFQNLQTNQAHKIAPKSPFFESWLKKRKELIIQFISALNESNFSKIGELAEYDTLCLHSVTMSAPPPENLIAFKPITLEIMHYTRKLRLQNYPIYFSIDTGPTPVLITQDEYLNEILDNLRSRFPKLEIFTGKIAGPSEVIKSDHPAANLLQNDIKNMMSTLEDQN